jgi:lipoprotein-anchoring transpeptidase ErfK/SrfK
MPTRRKAVALFLFSVPFLLGAGFFILFFTTAKATSLNQLSCKTNNYTGLYNFTSNTAFYDGEEVESPLFARNIEEESKTAVLGAATPSNKWIEVDLSEQKLKAWNGNTLFLETSIASGLPRTPTPIGEFHIWVKLRYAKMEGGSGKYYYNLPNVPYVMYFQNDKVPGYKGYGLHGVYWHNSFGTPRSHGCVNLPTTIAEQIYNWAEPNLPEGKRSVFASPENPGTKLIIHE